MAASLQTTTSALAPAFAVQFGVQSMMVNAAPCTSKLPQMLPPPWINSALMSKPVVISNCTKERSSVVGSNTSVWMV